MSAWPAEIEKEGETFRFKAERPGWLVYENEEHIILVGREEAISLCRGHEERAMKDEEAIQAILDAFAENLASLAGDYAGRRTAEVALAAMRPFLVAHEVKADEEAMLRALAQGSGVVFDRLEEGGPGLAKLRAQLVALRPLLAAREATVRAEERAKFKTIIRAAHEALCYAAPLASGTDSEAIFLRGRTAVRAAAAAAGASGSAGMGSAGAASPGAPTGEAEIRAAIQEIQNAAINAMNAAEGRPGTFWRGAREVCDAVNEAVFRIGAAIGEEQKERKP